MLDKVKYIVAPLQAATDLIASNPDELAKTLGKYNIKFEAVADEKFTRKLLKLIQSEGNVQIVKV